MYVSVFGSIFGCAQVIRAIVSYEFCGGQLDAVEVPPVWRRLQLCGSWLAGGTPGRPGREGSAALFGDRRRGERREALEVLDWSGQRDAVQSKAMDGYPQNQGTAASATCVVRDEEKGCLVRKKDGVKEVRRGGAGQCRAGQGRARPVTEKRGDERKRQERAEREERRGEEGRGGDWRLDGTVTVWSGNAWAGLKIPG
ncbi:hypothetical protein DL98DRAFT_625520 [Cadophora sp. DSE1049]|nr:hypothetical protein DL98DRAFT_625520 [Cadophora sp. DSE1049]